MRQMLIIVVAGLVLMGAGCSRHEDDARLVRADALMASRPDSALAILDSVTAAIDSGALTFDEADAAYYALLLTQARYRCYVPATSDTLITRALRYYQRHPQGDRLPRALLYSGTVAEELNDPTAAINWYRQAESATPPTNHALLGYIHLRAASLYVTELATINCAPAKEHAIQAISHLNEIGYSPYLSDSYRLLSSLYLDIKEDSAVYYLERARELAAENADSASLAGILQNLAVIAYDHHDYDAARVYSAEVTSRLSGYLDENVCYYYLVLSDLQLGKRDSALYQWKAAPAPGTFSDTLVYKMLEAHLYSLTGEPAKAWIAQEKNDRMTDSVFVNNRVAQLCDAERVYDEQQASRQHTSKMVVIAVIAAILLGVSALLSRLWIKSRQNSKQLNHELEELHEALASIESVKQIEIETINRAGGYRARMEALYRKALIEMIERPFILTKEGKKTQRLCDVIHPEFWVNLRAYLNTIYHGFVDHCEATYGLPKGDVRFLCLCCIDLPNRQIMRLMDLTSERYVANKKSNLLKTKLHSDLPLKAFIAAYLASHAPASEGV